MMGLRWGKHRHRAGYGEKDGAASENLNATKKIGTTETQRHREDKEGDEAIQKPAARPAF
jgi:hypothetical protein